MALNLQCAVLFSCFLLASGSFRIDGFDETRTEQVYTTADTYYYRYRFYHGEELNLVCRKMNEGTPGRVRWQVAEFLSTQNYDELQKKEVDMLEKQAKDEKKYIAVLDELVAESQRDDAPITLHMSYNTKKTIICIYENFNSGPLYIKYKLVWDASLAENPDIIIEGFNESRWTLFGINKVVGVYQYRYNFYAGENLNLVCKKLNEPIEGHIIWRTEGLNRYVNSTDGVLNVVLRPSDHNKTIYCTFKAPLYTRDIYTQLLVENPNPAKNVEASSATPSYMRTSPNTVEKRTLSSAGGDPCTLSSAGGNPSFYVEGLSGNNMHWHMLNGSCVTTLEYTKTPLILNLTCNFVINDSNARLHFQALSWNLGGTEVRREIRKDENITRVNNKFTIGPGDNETVISCHKFIADVHDVIAIKLSYIPPTIKTPSFNEVGPDVEWPSIIQRTKRENREEEQGKPYYTDKVEMELKVEIRSQTIQEYTCKTNSADESTTSKTNSADVNFTKGGQVAIFISLNKQTNCLSCNVNNKLTLVLFSEEEKKQHESNIKSVSIKKYINVTESLAGIWNCTSWSHKTQGQVIWEFLTPQYIDGNFTYLTASCLLNVTLRDPPSSTAAPKTITTTTAKPTTLKPAATEPTIIKHTTIKSYTTDPTTIKRIANEPTIIKHTTIKSSTTEPTTNKRIATKPTITEPNSTSSSTNAIDRDLNSEKEGQKIKPSSVGKKQKSKSKNTTRPLPSTVKPTHITEFNKTAKLMKEVETASTPAANDNITTHKPTAATDESALEANTEPSTSVVPMWVYGIVALAVLIVLITVIIVSHHACKHVKEEQRQERNDFTYENLGDDNSCQFPPNLESAYGVPCDTLTRSTNDSEVSPYATVNYQDGDTYSVPYIEKDLTKLYSKPLPKHLRKDLMYAKVLPKNMRGKENPYAEIEPKGKRDVTYAEIEAVTSNGKNVVKTPQPTYSEVRTGYVNLQGQNKSDYNNVIDPKSRYVNANVSEYAEPAYCELDQNKKNRK